MWCRLSILIATDGVFSFHLYNVRSAFCMILRASTSRWDESSPTRVSKPAGGQFYFYQANNANTFFFFFSYADGDIFKRRCPGYYVDGTFSANRSSFASPPFRTDGKRDAVRVSQAFLLRIAYACIYCMHRRARSKRLARWHARPSWIICLSCTCRPD